MSYQQIIGSFVSRLPKEATGLKETVATAFNIVENFKAKADAVLADGRLTAEGKRDRLKELLKAGPADHMKQLAEGASKAKASIVAQRAALAPKRPDDSTLSEMGRAEIRDYLRSLPDAERVRLALTGDKAVQEAILFAPSPVLSGVPEDIRSRVADAYVEASSGAKLASLAEDEAALADVQSAIRVAENMLTNAAEVK